MALLNSHSLCTRPVGFDGEFTHAKSACGQLSASTATACISDSARRAPTKYVGYATSGKTTFLDCKKVGSHATNSLEPITGSTSKSPVAPSFDFAQLLIALLSSGVPAVSG